MTDILFATEADNLDVYFAELPFCPPSDLALKTKTGVKFWVSSTVMSSVSAVWEILLRDRWKGTRTAHA
jgi:hypothetical protein